MCYEYCKCFTCIDSFLLPFLPPFLSFLFFLPRIRKFPGPGIELEPQLPACTTAAATPDSLTHCTVLGINPHLCSDLSCYSQIFNPLYQWELLH